MTEPVEKELNHFLETIKMRSEYDFSNYSINSLKRRVMKLLNDHNLDLNQLSEKISHDDKFLEAVAKRITVNTTELFRDPVMWRSLKENFLDKYPSGKKLRIWHSGCSTGQEVYSMMILLSEMKMLNRTEIYASDINEDVMKTARQGVYKFRFNKEYIDNFNKVINHNLPEKDHIPYTRYFFVDKAKDIFQMKQFLVRKPVYKKIDLVKAQNPFDFNFDLIVCRNVIIYFNYDLQNRVFEMFHDHMEKGACLMLGWHESIIGPLSSYYNKKHYLYYKK